MTATQKPHCPAASATSSRAPPGTASTRLTAAGLRSGHAPRLVANADWRTVTSASLAPLRHAHRAHRWGNRKFNIPQYVWTGVATGI